MAYQKIERESSENASILSEGFESGKGKIFIILYVQADHRR